MKKRPLITMSPDAQRFFTENAEALAEAAEEQRMLRAKRKASGTPDKMFIAGVDTAHTNIIICRRK